MKYILFVVVFTAVYTIVRPAIEKFMSRRK